MNQAIAKSIPRLYKPAIKLNRNPKLQMTLTLKGSSKGKTEPKKATYVKEDVITKDENLIPTPPELSIPPSFRFDIGKSMGFR